MTLSRIIATALLAATLAACGGKPDRPVATAGAPVVNELDTAVAALDRGDVDVARRALRSILKREPMNASALLLRNSIDGDAKEQLGPESYPYVVKPGETMGELADRLLGNRLKFYQLARYNGIENPSTLAAGATLRIPGEAPRPALTPRAEPVAPRPAAKPRPSAPKPATKTPATGTTAAPTAPAANPAAARSARAAGLAALNAGRVAQAVGYLRRATTLDPGNPVIQRDLARAQRIAATVHAKK